MTLQALQGRWAEGTTVGPHATPSPEHLEGGVWQKRVELLRETHCHACGLSLGRGSEGQSLGHYTQRLQEQGQPSAGAVTGRWQAVGF